MPPTTDPEIKSLADAIAGETLEPPVMVEPESDQDPADSGKPVDASEGKPVEAPSDAASSGDKPDDEAGSKPALVDLSKVKLDDLLKDPNIGPALNAWADRAAVAQVQAAVERSRSTVEEETRQRLEDRAFDREVQEMDEVELAESLRDPSFRTRYARSVERSQPTPNLDPNAVAEASQVFAYAAQIATYNRALANSGLSQEAKEALSADKYTDMGPDGIVKWGEDIMLALSKDAAEARAQELLEERWEAHRQERLAELDGSRPPMVNGRTTPPQLDLMKTPSSVLMEQALNKSSKPSGK